MLCEAGPGPGPLRKRRKYVITDDDLPPEVLRAIELGRKVEAIKLLQQATGLGFANAKVLVDAAARKRGQKSAHRRFVEEQTNLGALLKALLLVVALFAAYRYFFAA